MKNIANSGPMVRTASQAKGCNTAAAAATAAHQGDKLRIHLFSVDQAVATGSVALIPEGKLD